MTVGPRHVVQVIARLNVGGPASQVLGLAAGADPQRYRIDVLTGAVGPDEADWLQLHGGHTTVTTIPGLGRDPRPGADLLALRQLDRELGQLRPDLVHTHTAKAGALGRIVAARRRIPVVHTFHGHLLEGYFRPAARQAVIGTERVLARRSRRLLTVGAAVRDGLLAAGVGRPEQYRTVVPGVAPPAVPARAAARAALGVPDDVAVVAMVGRVTRIKRVDRALDLLRDLPAAHLLVAGGGDLLETLQRDSTDLAGRVHWLGWRADVATVFAAADVALLTSDNEGMPVSLIEAAMCGRPAVATGVGSVAEVIDDGRTGTVVPAGDRGALRDAVAHLLADPELRARMGAAATDHAAGRFRMATVVEQHQRIYDEVLSGC